MPRTAPERPAPDSGTVPRSYRVLAQTALGPESSAWRNGIVKSGAYPL